MMPELMLRSQADPALAPKIDVVARRMVASLFYLELDDAALPQWRNGIGRVVFTRRAVHRQQGITWSITARFHRHIAHDTAQMSFRTLQHV
jgi:hypothetical protein